MASSTGDASATLSLRVISQLPEPHANIFLNDVSKASTILDLKSRIREQIPSEPLPENQRLIYQGRALVRDTETLEQVFGANANRPDAVIIIHLVIRDLAPQASQPRTAARQHTAPQTRPQTHSHPNITDASYSRIVAHSSARASPFTHSNPSSASHTTAMPPSRNTQDDRNNLQLFLNSLTNTINMNRETLRRSLASQPQEVRDYCNRLLASPSTSDIEAPVHIAPALLAHIRHHASLIRHIMGERQRFLEAHPSLAGSQTSGAQSAITIPQSEHVSTPTQPLAQHDQQHLQHHQNQLALIHNHFVRGAQQNRSLSEHGANRAVRDMSSGSGIPPGFPPPMAMPNLQTVHPNLSALGLEPYPFNVFPPIERMRHYQSELDILRLQLQRFIDTHRASSTIPYAAATAQTEGARNELTEVIFLRNLGQRAINAALTRHNGWLPLHGPISPEDVAVLQAYHAQFKQQAAVVERLLTELEQRRGERDDSSTPRTGDAEQRDSLSTSSQPLLAAHSPRPGSNRTEVLNVEVARANQAIAAMNNQMAHANRSIAAANSAIAALNRAVSLANLQGGAPARNERDRQQLQRDVRATQDLAQAWAQEHNGEAPRPPGLHEAAQHVPQGMRNVNARVDLGQLLAPLLHHLWLLARIFGFILFFSGGGGNLRRTFLLGLAAGLYLVMQTVMMRGLREVLHRHFQNLLGPQRQGDQARVADRRAADGAAADAPPRQPSPGETAGDNSVANNPQVGGVTPEALAERLLRERRERDRGWLRERLRGAERIVTLFFATLYPGLQIMVRDRQPEEPVQEAVVPAQQAQGQENAGAAPAATDPTASADSPAADAASAVDGDGDDKNPGPLFVPAEANNQKHGPLSGYTEDSGEGSSSGVDARANAAAAARRRLQASHENEDEGHDDAASS